MGNKIITTVFLALLSVVVEELIRKHIREFLGSNRKDVWNMDPQGKCSPKVF